MCPGVGRSSCPRPGSDATSPQLRGGRRPDSRQRLGDRRPRPLRGRPGRDRLHGLRRRRPAEALVLHARSAAAVCGAARGRLGLDAAEPRRGAGGGRALHPHPRPRRPGAGRGIQRPDGRAPGLHRRPGSARGRDSRHARLGRDRALHDAVRGAQAARLPPGDARIAPAPGDRPAHGRRRHGLGRDRRAGAGAGARLRRRRVRDRAQACLAAGAPAPLVHGGHALPERARPGDRRTGPASRVSLGSGRGLCSRRGGAPYPVHARLRLEQPTPRRHAGGASSFARRGGRSFNFATSSAIVRPGHERETRRPAGADQAAARRELRRHIGGRVGSAGARHGRARQPAHAARGGGRDEHAAGCAGHAGPRPADAAAPERHRRGARARTGRQARRGAFVGPAHRHRPADGREGQKAPAAHAHRGGARRGGEPAAVSRAHRRRDHDHRVRAPDGRDDRRRGAAAHPRGGARQGVDLRVLRARGRDRPAAGRGLAARPRDGRARRSPSRR